ncbi:MAG: sugar transferase [Paracoccaceae bacterium]
MNPDLRVALDTVRPSHLRRAALSRRRAPLYRAVLKRGLDTALIVLALPVILPLVLGFALWIALDGGRPFYSQERLGKNGRVFRLWKLRSMVIDADARLDAYLAENPAAREEWAHTQKLKNDPRVTRAGRFLRRTSLDELPQLWNVLKGDMSLVGPRPMLVSQKSLYPGSAYYMLRPGVTGYWQVSGRNDTTFEARALYDAAYEADLSLGTDIRVLYRTVGVVLGGTGY